MHMTPNVATSSPLISYAVTCYINIQVPKVIVGNMGNESAVTWRQHAGMDPEKKQEVSEAVMQCASSGNPHL